MNWGESAIHADCPISPDGYHRAGTPDHSYVESESDDGRQNSDYDRRQTGGDEDCNDFINLDLVGRKEQMF